MQLELAGNLGFGPDVGVGVTIPYNPFCDDSAKDLKAWMSYVRDSNTGPIDKLTKAPAGVTVYLLAGRDKGFTGEFGYTWIDRIDSKEMDSCLLKYQTELAESFEEWKRKNEERYRKREEEWKRENEKRDRKHETELLASEAIRQGKALSYLTSFVLSAKHGNLSKAGWTIDREDVVAAESGGHERVSQYSQGGYILREFYDHDTQNPHVLRRELYDATGWNDIEGRPVPGRAILTEDHDYGKVALTMHARVGRPWKFSMEEPQYEEFLAKNTKSIPALTAYKFSQKGGFGANTESQALEHQVVDLENEM